jgi:hypothetical protein
MSCRWQAGASVPPPRVETDAITGDDVYLELVRARRRDDFVWLARSDGIPAAAVEELWQRLVASVPAGRRAPAGTDVALLPAAPRRSERED